MALAATLYNWPRADVSNIGAVLYAADPSIGTGYKRAFHVSDPIPAITPSADPANPEALLEYALAPINTFPGYDSSATSPPIRRSNLLLWVLAQSGCSRAKRWAIFEAALAALAAADGNNGIRYMFQQWRPPTSHDTVSEDATLELGTLPVWGI